jgi:hypothetical protein
VRPTDGHGLRSVPRRDQSRLDRLYERVAIRSHTSGNLLLTLC